MMKTTHNASETQAVAAEIAAQLNGGEVLCLHGEMGAGKTTFTTGLTRALGSKNEVVSPTFTLMNIYQIANNARLHSIVHIDTYRLENEAELYAIGAEDYVGAPGTVTVIEWPEKVRGLLANRKATDIYFEHGPDGTRLIRSPELA